MSVCDQRTDPKWRLEAAIITNKEDSGNVMAIWSQIGICGLVLQNEFTKVSIAYNQRWKPNFSQ